MAEINLIKIDGKPIQKLIEVISSGIGTIYKPRAIKKEAEAEAYKIEIIERAKAKALSEGKEIEADTYSRMQERILHQETKRQLNIDNVSQIAAEQLSQEQNVSDEPVDADWTSRFFNIVEDVSDEEMQNLWGRILAGEVKQPKSYSIRTLELIKNLSKREAQTFMTVANFAIQSGNGNYLFNTNDDKLLSEKFNINYGDISLLIEIGLIQPGDFVSHQLLQQTTDLQRVFVAGNIIIIATTKANSPTVLMPVNVFSNSANELLKLVKPAPPMEYLSAIAKSIKNDNVEVKYAMILARDGSNFRHTKPLLDFE